MTITFLCTTKIATSSIAKAMIVVRVKVEGKVRKAIVCKKRIQEIGARCIGAEEKGSRIHRDL